MSFCGRATEVREPPTPRPPPPPSLSPTPSPSAASASPRAPSCSSRRRTGSARWPAATSTQRRRGSLPTRRGSRQAERPALPTANQPTCQLVGKSNGACFSGAKAHLPTNSIIIIKVKKKGSAHVRAFPKVFVNFRVSWQSSKLPAFLHDPELVTCQIRTGSGHSTGLLRGNLVVFFAGCALDCLI